MGNSYVFEDAVLSVIARAVARVIFPPALSQDLRDYLVRMGLLDSDMRRIQEQELFYCLRDFHVRCYRDSTGVPAPFEVTYVREPENVAPVQEAKLTENYLLSCAVSERHMGTPEYRLVSAAHYELLEKIVRDLPEYKRAGWGEIAAPRDVEPEKPLSSVQSLLW